MFAYPQMIDIECQSVIQSGFNSTVKSLIWSGRPLRALKNPYVDDWEKNRQEEIRSLTSRGIIPLEYELDKLHSEGGLTGEIEDQVALR